jgi:ankyrin repeat protein
LDFGGDINRADISGKTPLMHAAARGCSMSVIYLFDAGADTLVMCKNGHSAKDYAETSGNTETIKLVAGISMRTE